MTDKTPSPPDAIVKLRAVVGAFPAACYAVIDGGHFPDLPALLRRERLSARSLFLDKADPDVQAAGPWLMATAQTPGALEFLLATAVAAPCAVFWCCDAGEVSLWRHLRSLNLVSVPTAAIEEDMRGEGAPASADSTSVYFRHYDPSVLGALLPGLSSHSFAKILGPAIEIAFIANDYGGVRRVIRDGNWPRARPGQMTFSMSEIEALNGRRLAASHIRIARYLRNVAPHDVGDASDEDLMRHVEISDMTGRDLGIRGEAGHSRWSLLMLLTNGRILHHQQARAFIAGGRATPDDQVKLLLTLTANAMRHELETGGRSR